MKCLFKIMVFILLVINLVSCSPRINNVSSDYVIRYINLKSVYEYIYNNSNEAQDVKRKIDSLNKKIVDLENSEVSGSKSEIIYYKGELVKVKEQEKKLKSEIYAKIKTAVNNIASEYNTDFILNSGDGVIYSRSVYDLTSELIKELKSLDDRSSPVYK